MSAAVSYANVATGSTSPATPEQTPSPIIKTEEPSTSTPEDLDLNDSKDQSQEQDQDQDQLPSPKASPKPEGRKQVNLSPAPVPEVNAWGSVTTSRSNSSLSNADLKFWPSPNELTESGSSLGANSQINKPKIGIVKTSKEKWIPFKASVVLSSSNGNKQNKHPKKTSQKTNQPNLSQKDSKKRKNKVEKKPNQSELKKDEDQKDDVKSEVQQEAIKPVEQEQVSEQTSEESQSLQQPQPLEQPQQAQQSQQPQQIHHQAPHHKQHHKQPHNTHPHHHLHQQQPQTQTHTHPQTHPQTHHFQQNGHQQRQARQYNNASRRYNNVKYYTNGFNRNQHPSGPFPTFHSRHHNNFNRQFNYNPQFQKNSTETLQSLIKQVEYYFSIENLVKDIFLRKQMNSKGWLPLQIIASFHRMNVLSFGDYNLIRKSIDELANIGHLEIAEFNNDVLKIRLNEGWDKWILPFELRDEIGKDESEFVKLIKREQESTAIDDKQEDVPEIN